LESPEREIAALEVEATKIEAHATELFASVLKLTDPKQQQGVLKQCRDEAEKAAGIRRRIRRLRDHL